MKQLYIILFLFCWPFLHYTAVCDEIKEGKRLESLTVGIILPLSGKQRSYASEALTSIKLALSQFKKEHPKLAHLIHLKVADDQSTTKGATKAFHSLLEKNASIMIGSLSDTITTQVASLARQHQLPLIIPSLNNQKVLNIAPHIFQASLASDYQGNVLARFAYKTLNKKKAVILLNPECIHALKIASSFKKKFLADGGNVLHQEHYKTTSDFQQHLDNVTEHKPEVLLFPSMDIKEAAIAMKLLNEKKQTLPILGPNKWHQPALLSLSKKTAYGHYYTVPFHLKQLETAPHHFFEDFKEKEHRLPSPLAVMSYHSLLLAAYSYKKAGTTRFNELTRTLKNIYFSGLLGPMQMTQAKFLEHQSTVIKLTKTGRQTEIVTPF